MSRMDSAVTTRLPRIPRWAAALVLLAASSALLQPVCAAYELRLATPSTAVLVPVDDGAQGGEHDEVCCAVVETDALVAPFPTGVAKAVLPAGVPVAQSYAGVAPAAIVPHAQPAPHAPPPFSLPYHVRSVRIQR
jgi:hypothetical protein